MPDAQAPGKWTPAKDEQDDLHAIDAAIARMQNVTTQDPYRLTIPQDEPRYHHNAASQAGLWLTNTPFHRSEHETTQYLTYHFHEPGKETYVLENSWRVEEPKVNGNASKHKSAPGATTPNGAPKKKISLDAYRKQKTGGIDTPERDALKGGDAPAKQPAVKGPIERVKAESEEMLAAVMESEEEVPSLKDAQAHKNDLKRKRDDETTSRPEKEVELYNAPSAKKVKASPKEEPASRSTQTSTEQDSQKADTSSKREEREETGLPPRLSPGMPPKLSPPLPAKLSPLHKGQDSNSNQEEAQNSQGTPSLPSRLSPTLPDNIEKSLQARNLPATSKSSELSAPNSVSKDKDNRLTPIKKAADSLTKRRSPAPRNGFRANSSSPAVRSDAEDRIRPKNAVTRAKTPERKRENEISVEKDSTTKPLGSGKPSLLVKIKYKKARKEDIQRILKMRPKLHASMSRVPESEEERPAFKTVERRNGERKDTGPVKGVAQKIGPVKKEKKPQPPPPPTEKAKEEDRPEKREEKHKEKQEKRPDKQPDKPPEKHAEKRSLPDDDRMGSPTKRRKTDSSETRKEPSTPAQREVDSPLAPKSGLQATPSARKDLLSHAMRREQSQDSSTTHNTPPAQISTPSLTSNQPNGLSKAPSSQPSNKTPKQQAWETEQKRLETLGRELKHAAQSDSQGSSKDHKLAAVKAIESFLCYLLAFSCLDEANLAADPKQSPSYTTWRTLHGFYGFVKRNTEQFTPLCGLSCSLGVVYTARILEIAAQYPTDGHSRASILEAHAALQKAANEAERKLDIDALQELFPKSWGQRSKKLPSTEKLESNKLGGGFKLPIGLTTTPVRAARAGHAMLQEWLEKEKIDYTLKLKL